MQPSNVLCFNIGGEALKKVQAAAEAVGTAVIAVPQSDFAQTLGALIGVLPRENKMCFSPFQEPMLIMSGFDRAKMDTFLDTLKKEGVYIPYKAMVTPVNLTWQCDALIEELKKEHEQMKKMRQKNE